MKSNVTPSTILELILWALAIFMIYAGVRGILDMLGVLSIA